MIKTSRALSSIAGLVGILALAACGTTAPEAPAESTETKAAAPVVDGACSGDEGVTLVVDSSALEGGERTESCVTADVEVAADVLEAAGLEIEGTEEYPEDIVCRVDGLPSADAPLGSTEDPEYVEECTSMPAAFGYWSIWVQPAGGEWGYAMEGLATQKVAKGEGLALLFTLDGAPAAP